MRLPSRAQNPCKSKGARLSSAYHSGMECEAPKPHLSRMFEAIAAIMDLDEGLTHLEIEFEEGHLRRWSTRDERSGPRSRRDGRSDEA
jgi:hypothetical protein